MLELLITLLVYALSLVVVGFGLGLGFGAGLKLAAVIETKLSRKTF